MIDNSRAVYRETGRIVDLPKSTSELADFSARAGRSDGESVGDCGLLASLPDGRFRGARIPVSYTHLTLPTTPYV